MKECELSDGDAVAIIIGEVVMGTVELQCSGEEIPHLRVRRWLGGPELLTLAGCEIACILIHRNWIAFDVKPGATEGTVRILDGDSYMSLCRVAGAGVRA